MKSKMPCRPGPVPVANDVHATGDCGGLGEASARKSPRSASARRWGSFPSSIQPETRRGSAPSKPRITSRGPWRPASCPPPHPPTIAARRAIATPCRRSALLLRKFPPQLDGVGGDAQPARRELVEVLRLPVEEAVLLELLHVRRERLVGDAEPGGQSVARVEVGRVGGRVVHAAVLEQDGALQVHPGRPVYHRRMMLSPRTPASAFRVSTTRRAVRATSG